MEWPGWKVSVASAWTSPQVRFGLHATSRFYVRQIAGSQATGAGIVKVAAGGGAVPVGKTAFVPASQCRQSQKLAAAAISISSAASLLTLLVWHCILAHVYPAALPT